MDIAASTWAEDDNANIAAAPDGAPEGMAPSGVNNVLRAHQGAIKRWYGWTTPRQTGGNAGSYLLAYGVGPSALVDGMTHLVQFHSTNAGAATLGVQGLPALPLHYFSAGLWRPVPPALWHDGELFRVAYHADSGAYRLVQLRNRTGEVHAFAGAQVPAGALLCAGQAVSRTLYAGLFAALGTSYGGGDGVSTFHLPDLRDRTGDRQGRHGRQRGRPDHQYPVGPRHGPAGGRGRHPKPHDIGVGDRHRLRVAGHFHRDRLRWHAGLRVGRRRHGDGL